MEQYKTNINVINQIFRNENDKMKRAVEKYRVSNTEEK